MTQVYASRGVTHAVETAAAWLLGLLWVLPLAYAFWTAFHPGEFSTRFVPTAPLTLDNFVNAWHAAPFARYFVNTVALVTMVLAAQLVLVTLAAYAFARLEFPGRGLLFALVLVQLMIMPDVLIVENYRTMAALGLKDTILAIGLPYMASAFGIFLLRQTFKTVPRELDEAARVEGCGPLAVLWKVYVPLAARSTSPTRWSASPITGTISSGRSSSPTRSSHDRSPSGCRCSRRPTRASTGRSSPRRRCSRRRRCSLPSCCSSGNSCSRSCGGNPLTASEDAMKLMTWNVQWCMGVDKRVDPARIVAEARRLADFDVLCLQEIADNYPHPRLENSAGEDQFAVLAGLLPATRRCRRRDRPSGGRRRSAPLRQHDPVAAAGAAGVPPPAASPVDPGENGMSRIAVEAVIAARSATCASSPPTSSGIR